MKSENFEMALDEIVWLITLLSNQSVLIYNLKHKDSPKELLTEEEVELLTSPLELSTYTKPCSKARRVMSSVRRAAQKTQQPGNRR